MKEGRRASGTSLREARPGAAELRRIVAWYLEHAYARWEGPGTTPYYCDPSRVGHFAVRPADLATGGEAALFRLFVAMSMYQARRDTVIMAQQRAMTRPLALSLLSPTRPRARAQRSPCEHLASAATFDAHCDVRKVGARATCGHLPRAACHVKDATLLLRRMGDMGKLPTSAWLHLWKDRPLRRELATMLAAHTDPRVRADALVERFSAVYRVGRKLATMFVSALSTPALAPGLTPWFPAVDGSGLVVVDTHVGRAVDQLRGAHAASTYESRARWLQEQAATIDLRKLRPELPRSSPRLVQQAVYVFCSRSNRMARRDPCSRAACAPCPSSLCPFARR
jgi:hypothetical protein